MSFQEVVNSMMNDSYECALTMEKCNIFIEASFREYDINCEEANLKVIKESGTDEDLKYLYEAAKEGLIVKLKRAIQKMVAALKEFIQRIVDKVKVTYGSKKAKEAMDKFEDLSKTNPKIKKIKIKVHDTEAEVKAIDEALSKLKAEESKVKAGAKTDKISDNVNTIKENCEKKRQNIAKAATLTLGAGAAIVLCKKYIDHLEKAELDPELKNEIEEVLSDPNIDPEDNTTCNVIEKIRTSRIILAREKFRAKLFGVRELTDKIRGAVVVPNLEKESVDEDMEESETLEIITPDSEIYEEVKVDGVDNDTTITDTEEDVEESVDIEALFNEIETSVNESSDDEIEEEYDESVDTLDLMLDVIESSLDDEPSDDDITESSITDLDDMLDEIHENVMLESTEDEMPDIDSLLDDIENSL